MNIFARGIDKRQRIEWIMDALSLGAVLQYCAYRFLQSTMFVIYYSQTYKLLTMALLLVFGGIRYICVLVKKWKRTDEKEEKVWFLLRCVGVWLLALPFFYVGWKHDYKFLIFLPICCMCLYDMEAEKILKSFAFVIGTMLIATVVCCLSGTVQNLAYTKSGRIVGAYGIINTTDFASYFTFLILIIWCGLKDHRWITNLFFALCSVGITCLVYWYTDSKTSLYCGALIVFLLFWDSLDENVFQKRGHCNSIGDKSRWISITAFPIIGALIILLVSCYGKGYSWAIQANDFLSDRLRVTWEPFCKYGIKQFGSLIETMHGSGATNIHYTTWSSGYGYIDSAYAMLVIRYGWIISCIVTGLWVWTSIRALHSRNNRIAFTMMVLAVHAFSEARVWDINYNIFLAMPFCALRQKPKEGLITIPCRKKEWVPWCMGIIILASIFFCLPRILSCFRSLFASKEWNSGIATYKSFLVCIGFTISVWTFWKGLCLLRLFKSKESVAMLTSAIMVILGGLICINVSINRWNHNQSDRLAYENPIIQQIQNTAKLPIYAAEGEELYYRSIKGFKDHLFSTNELSREPRGTMIVDSDVEAFGVTRTNGWYTQISQWSGLYTYDEAVINSLSDLGFVFVPYYNGLRSCNLRDTAIFNGLQSKNGSIPLLGPISIVTEEMETDQFRGAYEVYFSFSSFSSSKKDGTITVGVYGETGGKYIYERKISAEDFDSEGKCTYTVAYSQLEDVPKVVFVVKVEDGVDVTLTDISWKRTI